MYIIIAKELCRCGRSIEAATLLIVTSLIVFLIRPLNCIMPIILPLRGRNGPEKRMARQTIRSSSHSLQKDPTTSKLHSPNLPGSPDTENYYVRNRRKHENRTRHMVQPPNELKDAASSPDELYTKE